MTALMILYSHPNGPNGSVGANDDDADDDGRDQGTDDADDMCDAYAKGNDAELISRMLMMLMAMTML